jgi:two-component system, OmpR family, sensor kinase
MSIRLRLTLWYTGLLGVSLLLFGVLLYSLLQGVMTILIDDRLATQAREIVTQIRSQSSPAVALNDKAISIPAGDTFGSPVYIQITDLDGNRTQVSANLGDSSLPLPADYSAAVMSGTSRTYTADMAGGIRIHLLSMPILTAQTPIGAVQVGRSLAGLDESMAAIRTSLLMAVGAVLLLAAAGGVVLSRAALRPIKAITTTAQRITETRDLSQRIPVNVPNDELGKLTNTINGMLARLEGLFQTEQRLVADVSHELRTPLTTIRGNLELLRRGAVDDPVMRNEALCAMEAETARMGRLVNDLLLLAQADAGLQLNLQPVELDTLLLDVYRQAQLMSQQVTIRLGGEDEALVMGDHDRLRQLLLNLIDNAIKFTPAGGEVTLTLRRAGRVVQVAISDTGSGIAPDALPHVFERFYRSDRSRGRPGGSGLGLSIAQWVAEAHHGSLEAESQLNAGSTFTLSLPLAD